VWVIRILIIGTFSLAGERMFGQPGNRVRRSLPQQQPQQNMARNDYRPQQRPATVASTQSAAIHPSLAPASSFKPLPKPTPRTEPSSLHAAEPTYHNLATSQQVEKYELHA
jgi:hypothetical protein